MTCCKHRTHKTLLVAYVATDAVDRLSEIADTMEVSRSHLVRLALSNLLSSIDGSCDTRRGTQTSTKRALRRRYSVTVE